MPRIEPLSKRLDFFDSASPEAADIYLQHIAFPATQGSAEHPKLRELQLEADRLSFVRDVCAPSERRKMMRAARQKAQGTGGMTLGTLRE